MACMLIVRGIQNGHSYKRGSNDNTGTFKLKDKKVNVIAKKEKDKRKINSTHNKT